MQVKQEDISQFSYIYNDFSLGQRVKIHYLLFLIIIYPFLRVFQNYFYVIPVENHLFIWSVFNYLIFIATLVVLTINEKRYSSSIITVVSVAVILLFINLIFAEMASLKWAANWIGFIFIFTAVAQIFKSMTDGEMYIFQLKVLSLMKWIAVLFLGIIILSLILEPWYLDPRLFEYYALQSQNHLISMYRNTVGVFKQTFGVFLLFLIGYAFTHWHLLRKRQRFILLLFFLINLPAMFGVRTLILSLIVGSLVLFFLKNKFRLFVGILMFLVVVIQVYLNWAQIYIIIETLYDRLPSLQFAVSTMTTNLFGLGNGAYHIYAEENNARLLAQFGSELMEFDGVFWIAPESDLVYFIASWGILSVLFFTFFAYIIVVGTNLFHIKDL